MVLAPMFQDGTSMWVQSVSLDGFVPELADTLDKIPPPARGFILLHHAHGRPTAPHPQPDTALAVRERHLMIAPFTSLPRGTDTESLKDAIEWPTKFREEILRTGAIKDHSYMSFTKPEYCNPSAVVGAHGVQRLRKLKEKYNPGNAFPNAYPNLS